MTNLGIYSLADMPAETYHAGPSDQPALSANIAKILVSRSPKHAWHAHPRLNPQYQPEERASFDLGSAAHVLFLEGERFAERVAVLNFGDWRTKAAQTERDAAREQGRIPILEANWQRTVEMVQAIRDQLPRLDVDPLMFAGGKPEQTLIWEDEGVLCKARLDFLHDDLSAIDDLKTSSTSANPREWGRRTFWSTGCDIQAAFYLRGVQALFERTPEFRFLVCETQPPYGLSALTPSAEALQSGERRVEIALSKWREATESGAWRGYPTHLVEVDPPVWTENEIWELEQEEPI